MNTKAWLLLSLRLTCLSPIIAIQLASNAQVIPDSTLNSVVNQAGSTSQITGGTTRGNNLFHSFSEFSLNNNETAVFIPENNIVNILSRVTGANPSSILGTLGVSGNANLFFLNPNGILFGPNSRLDINGSFLASTANKFVLNSGNTQLDFLETNSIPQNLTSFNSIDMTFVGGSEPISLINSGHTITESSPFLPHTQNITPGLIVPFGQTLALFGSGVASNGGVLSAPAGNLVVGSIQQGTVNIQQLGGRLNFEVGNNSTFNDISLQTRTLFDASAGGNIRVYGSTIDLLDGSTVLVENLFNQSGGSIDVTATESLNIVGVSPLTIFRSSISGEAIGTGLAPTINVQAKNLSILDGGIIGIRNFLASRGGVINVNASESIKLFDSFTPSPTLFSSIASITTSSGPSADINITTKNLSLLNGGDIGSSTFGPGRSGNVFVNASESVSISGFTPIFLAPSTINAASFGMGDAGDVVVKTGILTLSNSGNIGTTALAQGNAGNVEVVASQSITMVGFAERNLVIPQSPLTPVESFIDSSASINPPLQAIFNLPSVPSGDSGQVTISTPNLALRDGARISVLNQGPGTAGNLIINSERIKLSNKSLFSAATASGNGGNIAAFATKSLILDNSDITASAQGFGNGGNLDINAGVIVLFNNSQASADALQASGGNIRITTQGLFTSKDSNITASSLLGVDGTIDINSPNIDFTKATLDLAIRPEVEQVKTSCNIGPGGTASEFTRPGSGGIASNPSNPGEYSVTANSQTEPQAQQEYYLDPETGKPEKYPNVVGWKSNPDGTIAMTSDPSEAVQTKAFCSKAANNSL